MKKIIAIAGIIILVILFLYIYLSSKTKSITDQIENGTLYHNSIDNLALSSCDNKDLVSGEKAINQGSKSKLDLHLGLFVLQTENPLKWTNEQFRWFSKSKCNDMSLLPVRAYPDKLLWKNRCSWLTKLVGCETAETDLRRWEAEHAESSSTEFNEAGIRFPIPPHIFHVNIGKPYTIQFYTEGNMIADTSSIKLYIPSEGADSTDSDPLEGIPPEAIKKMNNWQNLQGDRYVFDQKWQSENYIWNGTITREIYPVSFSSLPIRLEYMHSIHDDTLETLWTKIHTEVSMELDDNLASYQMYVEKNRIPVQ